MAIFISKTQPTLAKTTPLPLKKKIKSSKNLKTVIYKIMYLKLSIHKYFPFFLNETEEKVK